MPPCFLRYYEDPVNPVGTRETQPVADTQKIFLGNPTRARPPPNARAALAVEMEIMDKSLLRPRSTLALRSLEMDILMEVEFTVEFTPRICPRCAPRPAPSRHAPRSVPLAPRKTPPYTQHL